MKTLKFMLGRKSRLGILLMATGVNELLALSKATGVYSKHYATNFQFLALISTRNNMASRRPQS